MSLSQSHSTPWYFLKKEAIKGFKTVNAIYGTPCMPVTKMQTMDMYPTNRFLAKSLIF